MEQWSDLIIYILICEYIFILIMQYIKYICKIQMKYKLFFLFTQYGLNSVSNCEISGRREEMLLVIITRLVYNGPRVAKLTQQSENNFQ